MKAKFRCPKCSQTIQIGEKAMGKRGKCPGCQEVIKIPTAEQFAAAAAKAKRPKPEPKPAETDPFEEELSDTNKPAWDDLDLGEIGGAESGSVTLAPLPKAKAKKSRGGKGGDIERVRTGQKLVILGILLNMTSVLTGLMAGDQSPLSIVALVVTLAAALLGTFGLVRMAGGLGYSIISRVFLCFLTLFPLIGLITLLVLNSKATKRLRENGYQVGLFGA